MNSMKKSFLFLALLLLLGGCSRRNIPAPTPSANEAVSPAPIDAPVPTTAVVLSQLVADNHSALVGEADTFPDFLCLTNMGKDEVLMDGWHLSQKADRSGYALPRTVLSPGETLTIYCDGWNRDYHTDFSLKASGESVFLSNGEEQVLWALAYPSLGEDEGYVRMDDGSYAVLDCSTHAPSLPQGLRISECVSFSYTFTGLNSEYHDWIELYNAGSEPVSLADYTLSDKKDGEEALPLGNATLQSGEYMVIYCTGDDAPGSAWPNHPISLNASREVVYLRNREGKLIDHCSLHHIPLGGSFGREGEEWVYFTEPTPGKPNGSGCAQIASSVSADTPEGCYNTAEDLVVSLQGEGEVRYTLDGSIPNESSPLYTQPLHFDKTSVLRARSYETGKCPGPVSAWSYIINEGHTLPVASIIVDPVGFFLPLWQDWPGIYHVAANTIEPEFLTDVSFFEEDGGFHAQSTISLHGASTRTSREKKSLKLTFRNAYGGDLHYDLFGDGEERFHSLTFRSGYMEDNTLLRDSICQSTAIDCGAKVLPLRNRYCVLYINGEYWGIYSLREAYSKAYAADHLNSTTEQVQIVRSRVRPNYEPELVELFRYLSLNRHFWTQEHYEQVAEVIDLESLADWMVLEAYFYNYDVAGNIRYIRPTRDSNFLYAFFDMDFALRKTQMDWEYVCDIGNQFGYITAPIVTFPEFQALLLERMSLLYSQGLSQETMLAYLDSYTQELSPELEREYARWEAGRADTEKMVEELRSLITANRQERCFTAFCSKLYLDENALRNQYFAGRDLE